MATFLTLLASAIFIAAFIIYNKNLFKGQFTSHPVSWVLFTVITLVNSTSYFAMSGDWVKTLVAFTDCAVCIITLVVLLVTRRGTKKAVELADWVILGIGLIAILSWWLFRSATIGNLIIQGAAVIAFIPLYRAPQNEPPLPWFLWGSAFILQVSVVMLRWQGNVFDLVNPLQCLTLHAGLVILILRSRHLALA